ncbi:MAG: molybdopterin molybdotransferase MoeA [Betaproteobacteria bacterium]|nr:molybdopterin molybdotransferase MoeA [Betaproteobacteria bacterium]
MPPPLAHSADALLSVQQARELLLQLPAPELETRAVPLHDALQRVLGADLVAPFDVPAHDNSAMDGYALRAAELSPDAPTRLRVAGSGLAGHAFTGDLPPRSAVRIMTGAVLPPQCDTVVPQELCRSLDGEVEIAPGAASPGANVRRRGEDLAAGRPALHAGRLLRAADLGLAASLGVGELAVRRRLRVAFLSSGDELRSIGQRLDAGSIYDSNRHTLRAMLARLGCEPLDLGLVPDDPARIEAALRRGGEQADVIISSGGMGVGDADHLGRTLARLGDVAFRHVAMRPGRPLACGLLGGPGRRAVLIGLPGNPVAVMVTFYMLVRDMLLRFMGTQPAELPLLPVVCAQGLRKRPGRTEFQRACLQRLPDGRWQAVSTGNQGSGVLHSMSQADGLVVLHHDQGDVAAGDTVDFLPFDGLV